MRDMHLQLMREEKIKKVTNVTQAIFIVTENAKAHILNDTETTAFTTAKSNTKTRVLNSLESAALDVLEVYYKQSANWATDMTRGLVYIRTLISLAQQTEVMSEMNKEVLERGVDFILNTLEEKRQDREREVNLIENKDIELVIDLNVDNVSETESFDIREKVLDKKTEKVLAYIKPDIEKQIVAIKDRVQIQPNRNVSREIESHNRQQNRRQEILDILSDTPISIKDISTHILGCSEKTIQRELNALLSDRRIQKIGEKRWSKYLLR